METIFDHHPTVQEIKAIFGEVIDEESYEVLDQANEYGVIYQLYRLRGDEKKASLYYHKMESL
ncbi:MAG: hypothetical protein ACK4HQ_07800 [Brevinematales bacterium]